MSKIESETSVWKCFYTGHLVLSTKWLNAAVSGDWTSLKLVLQNKTRINSGVRLCLRSAHFLQFGVDHYWPQHPVSGHMSTTSDPIQKSCPFKSVLRQSAATFPPLNHLHFGTRAQTGIRSKGSRGLPLCVDGTWVPEPFPHSAR